MRRRIRFIPKQITDLEEILVQKEHNKVEAAQWLAASRVAISERATLIFVPARSPVLFLTHGTAVPGCPALRAHFELLQKAHNLTPFVSAMLSPR